MEWIPAVNLDPGLITEHKHERRALTRSVVAHPEPLVRTFGL